MEPKGTTPLADISRQPIRVGNPPVFLFTQAGVRLDRELVALSAQIRIAEALERIAAAQEAASQGVTDGNIISTPLVVLEPSPEDFLAIEKEGQRRG